jgi:DNA-binding transcriptional ArsR family regulator
MGDSRDESVPFDRSSGIEKPQQLRNDQVYRGLGSTRRRRLLHVLRERQECTVDELAGALAQWDDAGGERSTNEQKRVQIKLVHTDLPLLAEAGIVGYDRESEVVRSEPLHPLLDAVISRSVDPDTAP